MLSHFAIRFFLLAKHIFAFSESSSSGKVLNFKHFLFHLITWKNFPSFILHSATSVPLIRFFFLFMLLINFSGNKNDFSRKCFFKLKLNLRYKFKKIVMYKRKVLFQNKAPNINIELLLLNVSQTVENLKVSLIMNSLRTFWVF